MSGGPSSVVGPIRDHYRRYYRLVSGSHHRSLAVAVSGVRSRSARHGGNGFRFRIWCCDDFVGGSFLVFVGGRNLSIRYII
jgi:hypothetical protein